MIQCPNCGTMNIDGTLLCESCAWDLPEAPFEMPPPAAVPLANTAMPYPAATSGSFDVVPLDAPPIAPMAEPISMITGDAPMAALPMEAAPIADEMAPPAAVPFFEEPPPEMAPPPPAPVRPPTAVYPPPQTAVRPTPPPPPPPPRPPAPRVSTLAPEERPKLVVVRGLRTNIEYPIYDGENVIGRADDQAADIDLLDQEASNKVYASRQHARIIYEDGKMFVEDMNSANGTFVNRKRLEPHVKTSLRNGDYVQTGTVMFVVRY